ncbi:MAG: SDR family oxidoreductase [Gammaproteobacteria bacterium]|nr:SDR family oxidoreductase [Gammaproteobacteria bacterium]
MNSLKDNYQALVVGASGGIGSALVEALEHDGRCKAVATLDRRQEGFDITDEASVASHAAALGEQHGAFDLIIIATGVLTIDGVGPEKTLRRLDPAVMARAFAVNAIGPALAIKHLSPLLASGERSLMACLSARVGSIGDNHLGGWISYRASKAALHQIVRTTAIEIGRRRPGAVCVALHPGTVRTRLSDPYAGKRDRLEASGAAAQLLSVLDNLGPEDNGGFFAWDGSPIEW